MFSGTFAPIPLLSDRILMGLEGKEDISGTEAESINLETLFFISALNLWFIINPWSVFLIKC
jgi:hypothetical protein